VHTLAPALALAGDRLRLVFGTMGGPAQIQIHLQLLARIVVAGEPVEEAVAAPRWVLTPTSLLVERGLPPLAPPDRAVIEMPVPELAGHAHAILIDADGLDAACDPRADGLPVGD
jgi:gamma-glutamyltranspeptidase/glutathione hydrolase